MTGEHQKLRAEHDSSHEETLKVLIETDHALASAQEVISEARVKLKAATEKYEERLHGPDYIRSN